MKNTTCAFRGCTQALPAGAGRGTQYHTESCRKAEYRAKRAEREGRVIPLSSVGGNPAEEHTAPCSDRYDDVRAMWDQLVADVAADGITIVGASGAKAIHPAMRSFSALHAAMKDLEGNSSSDSDSDDVDALIERVLNATDENGEAI